MERHVSAQSRRNLEDLTPSLVVFDPDRCDQAGLGALASGYLTSYDELARVLRERRGERVLVVHHGAEVAARLLQGTLHRRVMTPTLLWDVTDGRERPPDLRRPT